MKFNNALGATSTGDVQGIQPTIKDSKKKKKDDVVRRPIKNKIINIGSITL